MNTKFIAFIFLLCLLSGREGIAQSSRVRETINEGWRFLDQGLAFGQNPVFVDDSSWKAINIPHTWNAFDPFDTEKSYKRGIGWYRKYISLSKEATKDERVFLQFEGVNQVADVFVNGIHVGRHKGGYTAFTFDITKALIKGKLQLISIMVNNAHDPFIAPLSVGYALYGGIYRDVWLVRTNNIHFDLSDYGSDGLYIQTPKVSDALANLSISGTIMNEGAHAQEVEVNSVILDKSKKQIGQFSSKLTLRPGEKASYKHLMDVKNPKLWSPDSPYLYTVVSTVIKNGKEVDKIFNPLGFRWYSFDSNQGFSLNGKKLKLRGANRHQDMKGKGSALSNEDHIRDMKILKDMGCNFIRIAHYPQDPEILKAADELGMLAWEEIPLVNYANINEEFLGNTKNMVREMIRQHFNHPSVVIWGFMNEIFLWGNNEDRINEQTDTVYTKNVAKYAKILDSLVRAEDPSRYSTLAMHGSNDYNKVGIEEIPQLASYNVYSGWYNGEFDDFGKFFDKKHTQKTNQNIFISEYGAEGEVRLNTDHPKRFDYTGQYQRMFHESYLKQISERDFISGSTIWNEFDFSQPDIGGPASHMNQKGMVTWDRTPKDVYYFYQANWNDKPMVYIAEKDWGVRAISTESKTYVITVYSNLDKVSFYADGKKIGEQKPGEFKKATFNVTLRKGENKLRAVGISKGKKAEDVLTIKVNKYDPKSDTDIYINVGSNAQYLDDTKTPWIEDSKFNGIYGYKNGTESVLSRKDPIRSDKDVPLYYSYLDDIRDYQINAKNGTYNLTLYFIENKSTEKGERVFDVSVNDTKVISALDLVKEAGFCVGTEKTVPVTVTNGEINLKFQPIAGKPVLSGIKLVRIK